MPSKVKFTVLGSYVAATAVQDGIAFVPAADVDTYAIPLTDPDKAPEILQKVVRKQRFAKQTDRTIDYICNLGSAVARWQHRVYDRNPETSQLIIDTVFHFLEATERQALAASLASASHYNTDLYRKLHESLSDHFSAGKRPNPKKIIEYYTEALKHLPRENLTESQNHALDYDIYTAERLRITEDIPLFPAWIRPQQILREAKGHIERLTGSGKYARIERTGHEWFNQAFESLPEAIRQTLDAVGCDAVLLAPGQKIPAGEKGSSKGLYNSVKKKCTFSGHDCSDLVMMEEFTHYLDDLTRTTTSYTWQKAMLQDYRSNRVWPDQIRNAFIFMSHDPFYSKGNTGWRDRISSFLDTQTQIKYGHQLEPMQSDERTVESLLDVLHLARYLNEIYHGSSIDYKKEKRYLGLLSRKPEDLMMEAFPNIYPLVRGPHAGKCLLQRYDGSILEVAAEDAQNQCRELKATIVTSFREQLEELYARKTGVARDTVHFDLSPEAFIPNVRHTTEAYRALA